MSFFTSLSSLDVLCFKLKKKKKKKRKKRSQMFLFLMGSFFVSVVLTSLHQ